MDHFAVSVINLSKRFRLYGRPWHRAAEWAAFGHIHYHTDFWALRDISFRLERGESLGIIGPNGAGKSTLLKILSRALYPTSGRFEVIGRAVSLLELGTGFNPDLTGIQNVFNSARLLGFDEPYVRSRLAAIVEFADLGDFIQRPIHIYSSGMYVRLAFSLFAFLDPEVYIVDEALAVGDSSFQKKCVERLKELRQRGVTILFVSHDLWRVEALCNRAIYLDRGIIKSAGEPVQVVKCYLDDVEAEAARAERVKETPPSSADVPLPEPKPLPPQFEMYADSPLRILRAWACDWEGNRRDGFGAQEGFEIVLQYQCRQAIREPVFRVVFALPDERRVSVIGWYPGESGFLEPGDGFVRWRIEGGTLYPRKYVIHASISTWDGVVYDTQFGIFELQIAGGDGRPVYRATDDLTACLKYAVKHEK